MRVGEALRVFSEKTLVEQFMTIGQELNCFNELLFSGNRNENKDIIAMYKKRLRILRRVISTKLEEVSESVKEMFAGLEFSVYVACIFNKRFMNKGQSITRENIDELEVEMKSNLEYFKDWIDEISLQNYLNNYHGRKKAEDFILYQDSFQKLVDVLKQKTIKTSFLEVLIQETVFIKAAEASIDSASTTQEWFQRLLSLSDLEILRKFDAACQQVVSKCLHLLRDSILFSKQSKFSSLWYGLYYSIDKEKFLENGGPFSQLPQDLHENQ